MKTLFTFFFSVMTFMTMAQSSAEKEIEAQLDKIIQAGESKDFATFRAAFSEDVIIYGSDPGEAPFETGPAMKSMEELFAMEGMKLTFELKDRDIMLDSKSKSALVVEQGYHSLLSKNMQTRIVYQFKKKGNKWLCNFYSVGMIPLNQDLPKLDKIATKN